MKRKIAILSIITIALSMALWFIPDIAEATSAKMYDLINPDGSVLAFAYAMVTVNKSSRNAARPRMKYPGIIVFRTDDVPSWPERDDKGVKITTDLVIDSATNAIIVYMTDSTIKRYDEQTGDDDAEGFINHVDGEFPGDNLEINEFIENNVGENLACMTFRPEFSDVRLHGSPDHPLRLTVEEQDDNEATKKTFNLKSIHQGAKSAFYEGSMPDLDASGSGLAS